MLTDTDAQHLEAVRARTIKDLAAVIGPSRDVALLDAPALINVGDSMIWEGQLAYMGRAGYRVRYVSDMQSYDPARLRRALPNGGAVLLRGGGNFGDIWVGHQDFRERVVTELKDYSVVQLTQSVLFKDPRRADQANRVLGSHPSFHLLVRDDLSMGRAEVSLPDIVHSRSLDMALGWTPSTPKTETSRAVIIARDDREASSGLVSAAESWKAPYQVHVTDWVRHSEHPKRWHAARRELAFNARAVRAQRRVSPRVPSLPQRSVESRLDYINKWNVGWATELFGSAKAMVVDRLHAHVLASLLGIPHVVLDNDHGKISAVFEEYTGQFSTAHYTTSVDEAREMLDAFMGA